MREPGRRELWVKNCVKCSLDLLTLKTHTTAQSVYTDARQWEIAGVGGELVVKWPDGRFLTTECVCDTGSSASRLFGEDSEEAAEHMLGVFVCVWAA